MDIFSTRGMNNMRVSKEWLESGLWLEFEISQVSTGSESGKGIWGFMQESGYNGNPGVYAW